MHYFHFEEYSKRLESLVNYIEIEARQFKPQKGQLCFSLDFIFFLTLFMYLSDRSISYGRRKIVDFYYIVSVGIYLLKMQI
jgi:hypothetical protein